MNTNETKQCTCTKIFENIADELDKQYALTQDLNVSESANELYHQLYDHAMSLFIAVGFEVVRSPETNKHTVKFKEDSEKTRVFD